MDRWISLSYPDYEDYARVQDSFESLAAWARFTKPLSARGGTDVVFGEAVTGGYFDVLRVHAAWAARVRGPLLLAGAVDSFAIHSGGQDG
jgi:hypothetical protein